MHLEALIEAAVERAVSRFFEKRTTAEVRPELLTVKQAAELAKVSEDTIRDWVNQGLLTRYGSPGAIRIRSDELLNVKPKPTSPDKTESEMALALLDGPEGK